MPRQRPNHPAHSITFFFRNNFLIFFRNNFLIKMRGIYLLLRREHRYYSDFLPERKKLLLYGKRTLASGRGL
jgi:hypothetical protein